MSRKTAYDMLSLDVFRESMEGIFSTRVSMETIDESPMTYKPMEEIVDTIVDTVAVDKIIKPVYNFKASETPGVPKKIICQFAVDNKSKTTRYNDLVKLIQVL